MTTATTQLYTVPQVMEILNYGKTLVYELLRSGRIRSVKEGRIRRIPASAITQYIASLESEAN